MKSATLGPEASSPGRRIRHVLPSGDIRPLLRGHFHQWATVGAIGAGTMLIVFAAPGVPRASAAIYAVCISVMLGTSALYHRVRWSPANHLRMQKADHSGIFLAIAGTYTPIATALEGWQKPALLVAAWTIAVAGIAVEWLPIKPPRAYVTTVYLLMGWIAVIAIPAMIAQLPGSALVLIVAGGAIYSGGAFVHGFRKPNPWPETFGFHEIWHACVVAAAACHYLAVWFVLAH